MWNSLLGPFVCFEENEVLWMWPKEFRLQFTFLVNDMAILFLNDEIWKDSACYWYFALMLVDLKLNFSLNISNANLPLMLNVFHFFSLYYWTHYNRKWNLLSCQWGTLQFGALSVKIPEASFALIYNVFSTVASTINMWRS